jgi:hypothetical protein
MILKTIWLGQPLLHLKTPQNLIEKINNKIDEEIKEKNFKSAVDQLSGKIKKEYDVTHFFKDPLLDTENFFKRSFFSYINNFSIDNSFKINKIEIHSAWINDQIKNEYQIVHRHSGNLLIGLSCILFLKVPDFGPEFTHSDDPKNGRTTLMCNGGGQFCVSNITFTPKEGEMLIFPYDVLHVVYPFNSEGIRRSLSINLDLYYTK